MGPWSCVQRRCREALAQSDTLQCAEGIARCQCMRYRDQRVHRNPAKLVTPVVPTSGVRFCLRWTMRNGETKPSTGPLARATLQPAKRRPLDPGGINE
jgi:hypothetical protein